MKPNFPLRQLRNSEGKIEVDAAADIMYGALSGLYPNKTDQRQVFDFIHKHCWGQHGVIINVAAEAGFDASEVEEKAAGQTRNDSRAPPSAAGRSSQPPSTTGRSLQRMSTDEEYAYLKMKQELLMLRKSLAEQSPPSAVHANTPAPPVRTPDSLKMTPQQPAVLLAQLPMMQSQQICEAAAHPSNSGVGGNPGAVSSGATPSKDTRRRMMAMVLAEAQKDQARLSGQELFEAAPKSKDMTQEETLRESLARAEIEVKQAQDALEKKKQ